MGAIQQMLLGRSSAASNTDDFSVNTIASYTQFADSPGTWTISGGTATVGAVNQSVLSRNGVSFADGEISCVITTANDAGLVLRLADNNNYYVLAIHDASSTSGTTNNFQLYKRVGGTFTQIGGNAAIAFTRGTSHTVKFRISGTTIQADFDGSVNVINQTDSALAAAGRVGIRAQNLGGANVNIFDSFTWP